MTERIHSMGEIAAIMDAADNEEPTDSEKTRLLVEEEYVLRVCERSAYLAELIRNTVAFCRRMAKR